MQILNPKVQALVNKISMHEADKTADFKIRDAASYDSLTAEFDRFTQRLSRPLAERMVTLANLKPMDHVIDIGTGTGIVALLAGEKLGAFGKVVGVDLSGRMLSAAKRKAAQQALASRVEFCQMDAEGLALRDSCFDVALSLFALLHFPNPLSALREVFRLLRPGGRAVLAVGSGPPLLSGSALSEGLQLLRRKLAARRGKLLVGPHALDDFAVYRIPERHGPEESALAQEGRGRAGTVPRLVREAGFAEVRTQWCGTEATLDTAEEFWEIQRTFSSIARKRLLGVDDRELNELRNEFLKVCRSVQSRGGKLIYPFAALYVVARRPSA
jgi:ubiquinone/menaquinone biosynthesis C-methylase UbiE